MRRRLSYPQRELRRTTLAYLKRLGWGLCVLPLLAGILVSVESVVFRGYALGLAQGLSVAFVVVGFTAVVLIAGGVQPVMAGVWGESFTRDELKRAAKRHISFGSVDSIEISSGDIDHLVVTRGGAVAIDTKWHSQPLNEAMIARDVTAASRSAMRARNVLRAIHQRPVVTPLVVVWGPGQQSAAAVGCVDGVAFVAGRGLNAWLQIHAASRNAYTEQQARNLLGELARFKQRVRPTPMTATSGRTLNPATRFRRLGGQPEPT